VLTSAKTFSGIAEVDTTAFRKIDIREGIKDAGNSKSVLVRSLKKSNLILGQSHFIKTVEDLYEVLVNNVPGIKFGLAFVESSGACKVRSEGMIPN